jgi:Fic family protein
MPLEIKMKNLRNFGIRFTHHSTKIEGSTLSLRDVESVVTNGIFPKNKSIADVVETKTHMELYEKIISITEELSIELLCKWHEELFHLTQHNIAGIIRDYPVVISGSNYEPPASKIEIDMLLDRLFKWYNKKKNILNPVFVASIMHYHFVSIHPFGDGNGRMARLLTNYLLNKSKYPLFDIDPKIRIQYYKALEKADKKEYPFPFIQWFSNAYIKDQKNYL